MYDLSIYLPVYMQCISHLYLAQALDEVEGCELRKSFATW